MFITNSMCKGGSAREKSDPNFELYWRFSAAFAGGITAVLECGKCSLARSKFS
jgi:hypothetical protein